MFDEKTLKKISEAGQKLAEVFQELREKLLEACGETVEYLKELTETLQKAFEKIEEHERLLIRPPKWYSKVSKSIIIVNRSKLHYCRNNC